MEFEALVRRRPRVRAYRPEPVKGEEGKVGVIALVVFFLPVTFMMHNFWTVEDEMMKMAEMVNFTKNLGLMGSALMFLAIETPWPFSLGG